MPMKVPTPALTTIGLIVGQEQFFISRGTRLRPSTSSIARTTGTKTWAGRRSVSPAPDTMAKEKPDQQRTIPAMNNTAQHAAISIANNEHKTGREPGRQRRAPQMASLAEPGYLTKQKNTNKHHIA